MGFAAKEIYDRYMVGIHLRVSNDGSAAHACCGKTEEEQKNKVTTVAPIYLYLEK